MAGESVNGFHTLGNDRDGSGEPLRVNGHGQSAATPNKLIVLKGAIRSRLAKISRLRWLRSLYIIDLNAGPGWNHVDGKRLPGTPLIVSEVIRESGLECRHVVVDDSPAVCKSLYNQWQLGASNTSIICCDNSEYLSTCYPDRESGGIIICDPNGPAGLPYEELLEFSKRARHFDYIVNHNLTAAMRCNGVHDPKFARGMKRYAPLADRHTAIRVFGKDFHLVGENRSGSYTWLLFVCTNDPTLKSERRYGLYRSDTLDGKRILGHAGVPIQTELRL